MSEDDDLCARKLAEAPRHENLELQIINRDRERRTLKPVFALREKRHTHPTSPRKHRP